MSEAAGEHGGLQDDLVGGPRRGVITNEVNGERVAQRMVKVVPGQRRRGDTTRVLTPSRSISDPLKTFRRRIALPVAPLIS
jgi:hypothetical protein